MSMTRTTENPESTMPETKCSDEPDTKYIKGGNCLHPGQRNKDRLEIRNPGSFEGVLVIMPTYSNVFYATVLKTREQ